MRLIRQCCGGVCHDGKNCEDRALREYRKKHNRNWLRSIIRSPLLPFIIGYLVGKLL